MIVFPNAKINIGLNIKSKRADGFHNIESIFYPIPWVDILEIQPANEFCFTTSGLKINGDMSTNLVVKAFNLLKKEYQIKNCHIHLHKIIPMGAGLGGGSANATFTLTALNKLFNLNINNKKLKILADSLGSDCSFFVENKQKFVSGKGEELLNIDLDLKTKYIKLVNPNIHISTAEAFRNIKINDSCIRLDNITLKSIYQKDNKIVNNFESTVFKQYPELLKLKNKIKKEGAFFTSMTGTGSTIFGLFDSKPIATFKNYNEVIFKL